MIDISKGRYWDEGIQLVEKLNNLLASCITALTKGIWNIMFLGMAIKAKRFSIRDFVSQFWKIRKLFNMVCMKISTTIIATTDAGIIISFKNFCSPFPVLKNCSCCFDFRTYATFPIWIILPIKRTITGNTFIYSTFAQSLFMFLSKFSSLAWWFISTPISGSFSRFNRSNWWFFYLNSNTRMAFNIKTILPRFIRRELFFRFPLFAFLTSFLSFTEKKIFIQRESKFSSPSTENTFSLICKFHNIIPIIAWRSL